MTEPDIHLVIGAGEVGRALSSVLSAPLMDVHDSIPSALEEPDIDFLHIAFPVPETSENIPDRGAEFKRFVREYVELWEPGHVVIHSTVPVGLTDAIGVEVSAHCPVTHSPVRGRHPNLAPSLTVFDKWFGGPTMPAAVDAAEAWDRAVMSRLNGSRSRAVSNANTTEFAKLAELAHYGAEIRIQKELYAAARAMSPDIDPEVAITEFGQSYNDGWALLEEIRFMKPTLEEVPGPIGGHCVAQNTPMLGSDFFSSLVESIGPDMWDRYASIREEAGQEPLT